MKKRIKMFLGIMLACVIISMPVVNAKAAILEACVGGAGGATVSTTQTTVRTKTLPPLPSNSGATYYNGLAYNIIADFLGGGGVAGKVMEKYRPDEAAPLFQ